MPAAHILGDNTAKTKVASLDPRKHLDIYGTLMFLFANLMGQPVSVDPVYFKNPKRDSALVALAGPFSNFLLH